MQGWFPLPTLSLVHSFSINKSIPVLLKIVDGTGKIYKERSPTHCFFFSAEMVHYLTQSMFLIPFCGFHKLQTPQAFVPQSLAALVLCACYLVELFSGNQ